MNREKCPNAGFTLLARSRYFAQLRMKIFSRNEVEKNLPRARFV